MLKIIDATNDILNSSEVASEAMREGVLNLSAFAEQIHSQIEEKTWKKVKKSTIVVALSRLAKKRQQLSKIKPDLVLDELSIKSPLCDITFEKSQVILEKARSLSQHLAKNSPQFFTLTEGIDEITVVISQEQLPVLQEYFATKPKSLYTDLVGMTVRFSEKYLPQPNVIYAILSALAMKRINIIEIVSTYTELTVIIQKNEMEMAIQALNRFFT